MAEEPNSHAGVDTASAGYKINFLGCWAQSGRSTSTSRAAAVLAALRPMPFGAGVSLFVVDLTGELSGTSSFH